jgi:hypothetical protein
MLLFSTLHSQNIAVFISTFSNIAVLQLRFQKVAVFTFAFSSFSKCCRFFNHIHQYSAG